MKDAIVRRGIVTKRSCRGSSGEVEGQPIVIRVKSLKRVAALRYKKAAFLRRRLGEELRRLTRPLLLPGGISIALAIVAVFVVGLLTGSDAALIGLSVLFGALAVVAGCWLVATRKQLQQAERSRQDLALELYRTGDAESKPAATRAVMARSLLSAGHALEAAQLVSDPAVLAALDRPTLRELRDSLRQRGYLRKARAISSGTSQRETLEESLLDGEIAVLSGAFVPSAPQAPPGFAPQPDRVLHLVGNSLPHHQSGYTLRTHYTAVAQRAAGLDPHVVTQMGFGHFGVDEVDGIRYHRLPGQGRGTEPLTTWLQSHTESVAGLVAKLRPAVLHAASDYVNAVTALAVGWAFGIPVVYESRGFWEETWLQRQAQKYGWTDLSRLEADYGLPDVYMWRREIEDRCRREADRVVTLAEVMAERIAAGGVARDRITVIPNGVDVDSFPVLSRNAGLAQELGIGAGVRTVGYISSIVEYEGIDTLIEAFAQLRSMSSTPVKLLVVGDGPERARLEQIADPADVIFTGRVQHSAVLDYYSLIDIFVVPRKPFEVCHLVTPLKPFEALSTGRTLVMSDVRALASIAEQSDAAELFEAGNPRALATLLAKLLDDPQRCRRLAEQGASWVRAHRTWKSNAELYLSLYKSI